MEHGARLFSLFRGLGEEGPGILTYIGVILELALLRPRRVPYCLFGFMAQRADTTWHVRTSAPGGSTCDS